MSSSVLDDDEPVQTPKLATPLQYTAAPRDKEPGTSKTDEGLEELRRWQQERLERRLRGEYETQVRKLVEVVGGNSDKPARIHTVRIEGADHARTSFLNSLIQPNLSSGRETTLDDVIRTSKIISSRLQDADIFRSVSTTLERSWSPLAEPDDVDVVFRVKERGRWFFKTATDVGNQEGTASITGRALNAFGGAETLEGNASFGTKTKQAFQVRLEAPLAELDHTLRTRGELSVFASERDYTSFASVMEGVKGVKAAIRTPWRYGAHELAYEFTSRHLGRLADFASLSMREAAGHSIKSAVAHTYLRDTRDDTMFATRGMYFKASSELAGLSGDVAHAKGETAFQASRVIGHGLSLSLATGAGVIWPLALWASRPATAPTMFSDRFQLGGPLSVRTFKQNGLGPKDSADSLGGDMYWNAGLSVFSDIPKKPHWPVKLHAFVNAGRLDAFDRSQPIDLLSAVKKSITQPSISAGLGLIYRFDPVRVEVNFGVPLVSSRSDASRKGFQVGMGLEFL